jgi:hypothetical protein
MTTRYVAQYHMHGALVTEGEPWLNRADAEREANLWASIRALRETVTGNARDGYYAGATGRIAVVEQEQSA